MVMKYIEVQDAFRILILILNIDDEIIEKILLSNELLLGPEINGKITMNVDSFLKLFNKHC
jgi:hypothetical protein